jgi:hypothetical protein
MPVLYQVSIVIPGQRVLVNKLEKIDSDVKALVKKINDFQTKMKTFDAKLDIMKQMMNL